VFINVNLGQHNLAILCRHQRLQSWNQHLAWPTPTEHTQQSQHEHITMKVKVKEAYLHSIYYLSCSPVCAKVWHILTRDHRVLPATQMFIHKWNEPYLPTHQPHSVTALWLVLISRPTEGRRLSWPWWLGEILRWFARPKMVTSHSIRRHH